VAGHQSLRRRSSAGGRFRPRQDRAIRNFASARRQRRIDESRVPLHHVYTAVSERDVAHRVAIPTRQISRIPRHTLLTHKHRAPPSCGIRHRAVASSVMSRAIIGHASAVRVYKIEQPHQTQTRYCSPDFGKSAFPVVNSKMEIRNKPVRSASEFTDPSLSGSLRW